MKPLYYFQKTNKDRFDTNTSLHISPCGNISDTMSSLNDDWLPKLMDYAKLFAASSKPTYATSNNNLT